MISAYIDTVILYCLDRFNGERSIYAVAHLLNGKKSSQTIQDAHLFHLTPLFQSYPLLSREELKARIDQLVGQGFIVRKENDDFILTETGVEYLRKQLQQKPLPAFLNGWEFHSTTAVFWERLSLLTQVCSNLVYANSRYLPIQQKAETQIWLKNFLKKSEQKRNELAENLYSELVTLLAAEASINPTVFVLRLTGYQKFGLTPNQAAAFLNLEVAEYQLQFLNILHYMIGTVRNHSAKYPLLFSILSDISQHYAFTMSTAKTYSLLKEGLTIDKIAEMRKLKRSTIEDHLVEIALLNEKFDISPFVSIDMQKLILHGAAVAKSKQLKEIRRHTPGAEYFQIRLVIAKYGEQNGSEKPIIQIL